MFAGLRHHRLVGGDDEQHGVDPAHTGEHRPHEALVSGHIDKRQHGVADAGMGKAQLDADAACLLFLQAIGVGAGERLDERTLAVIDVPGRRDREVHGQPLRPLTAFLIARSRLPGRPLGGGRSPFGAALLVRGPRLRSD